MNKTVWIVILVIIVAALAWYFYFAPQSSKEGVEDAMTEETMTDDTAMRESDSMIKVEGDIELSTQ